MSRYDTRKASRQAANIITRAKKDMIVWIEGLNHLPSENEMISWQAGYVAGVNRLAIVKDQEDKA